MKRSRAFGGNSRRSSPDGFTLIEILIVVVIIGILSTILFPVFNKARENARRASCQSNLRQIGFAVMQYLQDYDDRFMMGNMAVASYIGTGWSGQLYPYVKSTEVFRCPSDVGRIAAPAVAPSKYYSYRYNVGMVRDVQINVDDPFDHVLRAFQVNQPSRTVLAYECSGNAFTMNPAEIQSAAGNGEKFDDIGVGLPGGTTMWPRINWVTFQPIGPYERHLKGANYLCVDGHVKWLMSNQVSYGYRAATTTGGEFYYGGSNTLFAQGSEYAGGDRKPLTMSYR